MPYIRTVSPQAAKGLVKRIYDEALRRAGRIWNVLRIQSIRPEALQASLGMYQVLMHGRSPLSRAQREMIAVVVSRVNNCYY